MARAAVPDDAFAMLREEQTATSALKHPQPLSDTPSSVTVVTASEIRAMGYRTLGEALRWVRGMFVTNDRNYDYVGVRGLLRPGDYNNKVLLAIDGHTMNGFMYDDAYFGPELGLDMEQVDRIEIVRGPGSALYGSDAVLAVVQVITRAAHREPGVTVSARGGSLDERRGFASMAMAEPGRPELQASVSWFDTHGADVALPGLSGTGNDLVRGLDAQRALAFLGSADFAGYRFELKLNDRRKTVPTASFGTTVDDPRYQTWDGNDFAELSKVGALSRSLELHTRAWWSGPHYHGLFPTPHAPDTLSVLNDDRGRGDAIGSEWRLSWSPARRATTTFGMEAGRELDGRFYNADLAPARVYFERTVTGSYVAGYLQEELRLGRALLTSGVRLDGRRGTGAVASPRADLVWHASDATAFKLLAGSAFREPSPYEQVYYGVGEIPPASDLAPEHVTTIETDVERRAGPLTSTLALYHSAMRDLIDLVAVDSSNVQFRNGSRVRSNGVEGELALVARTGDRLRLAAAWQRSERIETGIELTNSPRWDAQLLWMHAPGDGRWSMGAGVRYLSPRLTLAQAWTPATCVADARLSRRLGPFTAAAAVHNLADARTSDPASSEQRVDLIPGDRRTVLFELAWHAAGR